MSDGPAPSFAVSKPRQVVRADGTVSETHGPSQYGTSKLGPSRHGEGCACWRCRGIQPGETSPALKHGAYSTVAISPRAAELADLIRETAPLYEPCDEPALRSLAIILARVERAESALQKADAVLDSEDAGPLAAYDETFSRLQADLRRWLVAAEKYFAAFGLTPGSRARLGVDVARAHRLTVVELHERAAIEGDAVEEAL